tara:strand:- start:222 stop:356 length:135 start_codon:yes stop_codon:yes gene_type:complete
MPKTKKKQSYKQMMAAILKPKTKPEEKTIEKVTGGGVPSKLDKI